MRPDIEVWWKILLTAFFFLAFLYLFYKKTTWFRNLTHQTIISVPISARIVRAHILSEIFDTVSTLVGAGCPFIEAVSESSSITNFIPYKTALLFSVKEMQTGSDLSSSLGHYPRLFPSLVVDSIAVGERTGNMEAIVSQMGRYYTRELKAALIGFSKLIEPALMIAVGIIVGAAALSIILPIYEISQHLSG